MSRSRSFPRVTTYARGADSVVALSLRKSSRHIMSTIHDADSIELYETRKRLKQLLTAVNHGAQHKFLRIVHPSREDTARDICSRTLMISEN